MAMSSINLQTLVGTLQGLGKGVGEEGSRSAPSSAQRVMLNMQPWQEKGSGWEKKRTTLARDSYSTWGLGKKK